jgi:DNA-binding MarR family transcriptional regulator
MSDATDLRDALREFIRRFGLLEEHQTPCGEPLRVPQAHALMILERDDRKRPPRISTLGEDLSLDKANVSRLCQRMETQGYIDLKPCPDDGRAKRVHLTEDGKRVAKWVEASSRQRFQQLLEAVDQRSPDEILDTVDALNRALKKMPPNKGGETNA